MKLIDVDALKAVYGMGDDCKDCKRDSRSCRYNTIYTMMDFCGLIDEAPIVDAVTVKHGRWKRNKNGTYSCSECQSWIPNEQKYYANFCLYCGADMRKDSDGHE